MAFETAIRNPERYKGILSALSSFQYRILDDSVLLEINVKLHLSGVVTLSRSIDVCSLSELELYNEIIEANKTRNADGGFPKGYQSRFWTYVRTLSEFGFVYARYNKPLQFSKVAQALISNELDEQEAFSMQAMLYNRRSPYRNVSNDFNYIRFILQVLLAPQVRVKGISYDEFVLSLFSKDGNVSEFLQAINENSFNSTNIYDFICTHYYITTNKNTVLRDYPDVVLRMLRITGFITIIYKGKQYIYINEERVQSIEKLLHIDFSFTDKQKNEDIAYFTAQDAMFPQLKQLIISFRAIENISGIDYSKRIAHIVSLYSLDSNAVTSRIKDLQSGNSKNDMIFKYIPEPLKLEFYIALLLFIVYGKEYAIKPNYKIDSLGMPISHAPGNKGDIEVTYKNIYWLIEVTLIRSRTQQLNAETTTTVRHLLSTTFASISMRYLSFVAPYIHTDTEEWYKYAICKERANNDTINIKPYTIEEFVNVTLEKKNLEDMQAYSQGVVTEFRKT